jgi:hypothetical protein
MKYNLRYAAFTAIAALALSTGSAQATSVTMNFEGFACNSGVFGVTNATCTAASNTQSVGSDYGSVPGLLTVLFGNIPGIGGSLGIGQGQIVFSTSPDFGVFEFGNGSTPSQIFFTPAGGFEVSLVSFAHRRASATLTPSDFSLLDPNGSPVYSLQPVGGSIATEIIQNVNSAYFAGPITFQYGSASGLTVVDDIVLDVRQVSSNNPVPEPSTWASLGLGLAALVASRRRR